MMQTVKGLLKKYREIIMYLIFGVLTTVVNFIVYYILPHNEAPMFSIDIFGYTLDVSEWLIANVAAWVAAVVFAFVVNKIFVFEDKNNSFKAVMRQIWQFVSVRIVSFVLETVLMWVLIDIIHMSTNIAKIPVAVLTVVINYIASKLFIFRKKSKNETEV